jgi:large subunit ribosomal protein L16
MLQPSKSKFRKAFKGRVYGNSNNGNDIVFGEYALRARERCRLSSRQLEAARKVLARAVKKRGKVWIRVFPDVPVSRKPADVRMGKGKGSPEFWVFRIAPGRLIFEISGIDEDGAFDVLLQAAAKLPIRCKVISAKYGEVHDEA